MRKFFLAALATLTLLAGFVPSTYAQMADGPNSFGFAFAADYGKWTFHGRDTIASGAQSVTIKETEGSATTADGRTFRPLSTTAPILVDAGTANSETVTPSSVTCAAGALTCVFSATFSNSHSGNFTIQSGTYGIAEAKNAILARTTGGTVVVANGFSGAAGSSSITSGFNGTSTVNILDVRAGVFQFYSSSGSTYSATLSPFNTTTAASTDVATAVGSSFFYTGGRSNVTNFSEVDVANAANTSGAKLGFLKTRATSADGNANTVVVTGDKLGEIHAFGADGADYIDSAGIEFVSTGTIASTRVPSKITFYTGTDAAPTVKTLALTLDKDQSATFAGAITTTNVTDSGLTSGRVPIASTGGLLVDDSDLTFATDTLTATKLVGSTSLNTPLINNTAGALALTTTTSGNITLTPAAAATAAVAMGAARFELAKGSTLATDSCSTGDCTLGGDGNVFVTSGTTAVDGFATAGWQAGSILYIVAGSSVTMNDGGTVGGGFAAMALAGNDSMTAGDTLMLVYDGTSFKELARSNND